MEKHIKTFEDHTTNTHITNFSEIGGGDWSAERIVNNKNGKFSYIKIGDEWTKKDNISRTENSHAIWMTDEESEEFITIHLEYDKISKLYKEKLNSYKMNKVRIPDNRVW